jgi:hypothetical protein
MVHRKKCRMQGRASRAALVRQRLPVHRPIVDPLSTERCSLFPQVNAHLMRAARFQAAFHKREIPKVLHEADMRDGALAMPWLRTAAATAVAAIGNQEAVDASGLSMAPDKGQVPAFDGMAAKLLAELALGVRGACQDHQAACVPVQPVHGTYSFTGAFVQQGGEQVYECGREKATAAFAELRCLVSVPNRGQAGGLVHHNDVGVGEDDLQLWIGSGLARSCFATGVPRRLVPPLCRIICQDFEALAGPHAAIGVGAGGAAETDAVILNEAVNIGPGYPQARSQERRHGSAGIGFPDHNGRHELFFVAQNNIVAAKRRRFIVSRSPRAYRYNG